MKGGKPLWTVNEVPFWEIHNIESILNNIFYETFIRGEE